MSVEGISRVVFRGDAPLQCGRHLVLGSPDIRSEEKASSSCLCFLLSTPKVLLLLPPPSLPFTDISLRLLWPSIVE